MARYYISGKQCRNHISRCFDLTFTTATFTCPARGRFRHPENDWMFYLCSGPKERACVCACPLTRIFDPGRAVCRRFSPGFKSNDDVIATPEKVALNTTVKPTTTTTTTTTMNTSKAFNSHEKPTKSNRTNHRATHAPHGQRRETRPPYATSRPLRLVKRRQTAARSLSPIEDYSLFPAWAIALLVMIGVIVMMFVVLAMY